MENVHVDEYMHNITPGDYKYCKNIEQVKEEEMNAGTILQRNVRKVSWNDHLKQIYMKGGNQLCEYPEEDSGRQREEQG